MIRVLFMASVFLSLSAVAQTQIEKVKVVVPKSVPAFYDAREINMGGGRILTRVVSKVLDDHMECFIGEGISAGLYEVTQTIETVRTRIYSVYGAKLSERDLYESLQARAVEIVEKTNPSIQVEQGNKTQLLSYTEIQEQIKRENANFAAREKITLQAAAAAERRRALDSDSRYRLKAAIHNAYERVQDELQPFYAAKDELILREVKKLANQFPASLRTDQVMVRLTASNMSTVMCISERSESHAPYSGATMIKKLAQLGLRVISEKSSVRSSVRNSAAQSVPSER